MSDVIKIESIINGIDDTAQVEDVQFGQLIAAFEKRGFGALLMLPALIALSPLSVVPGIPTVCGLSIMLISVQLLYGRQHIWLPSKLSKVKLKASRVKKAAQILRPIGRRLDLMLIPRWEFVDSKAFFWLAAIICAVSGLFMVPLEVVPFAVTIPNLIVFVIALGICTNDGVVALVGVGIAMLAVATAISMLL
ncbi:exopolysaccharide synthesis, exoD [Catenovulum agarivorans DS-2]|uniref:Exopolysaccharide synthesis, exoD n=1 Tax=Catenovulum agarivorans DS-2 TaxID=1328313 RepID=W7QG27_9ALTE|nr:exopolysaccharide biosynthesis protein [Catenovulum agarivorans]EWH10856.1 exopolysaccharide synthesis, exoD [Catenovulum agarivorans DS-2]